MSKIKTTEKAIKNAYNNVISVGYCDLQNLLYDLEPTFYTCGVYGWNSDIYIIDYNTCIVTGYRPFGNIHASYNGICNKYDTKARKLYRDTIDNGGSYELAIKKIAKLREKFIKECLELNK